MEEFVGVDFDVLQGLRDALLEVFAELGDNGGAEFADFLNPSLNSGNELTQGGGERFAFACAVLIEARQGFSHELEVAFFGGFLVGDRLFLADDSRETEKHFEADFRLYF